MKKSNEVLVSCFLPVYNAAIHLENWCKLNLPELGSVDAELVVVDNGSTDSTLDILQSFDYSNIQIIRHNENLGIEASFVTAKHFIGGKYRMLLPADDWLAPEYLQHALEVMEQDDEVRVVYGQTYMVDIASGSKRLREAPLRPLGKHVESPLSALVFNNFVPDISLYRSADLNCSVNSEEWFLPGGQAVVFTKGCVYRLGGDQCFSGKSPNQLSKQFEIDGRYFDFFQNRYAELISSRRLSSSDSFCTSLLQRNFYSGAHIFDAFEEVIDRGHPYVKNAVRNNFQKILINMALLLFDDLVLEADALKFKEIGRLGTFEHLNRVIELVDATHVTNLKAALSQRGASHFIK